MFSNGDGVELFVYADVVDANGEVVPDAEPRVDFTIEGPGRLVTPVPRRRSGRPERESKGGVVRAEAGIATALAQAGDLPGALIVRAHAAGLRAGVATIGRVP